MVYFQLSCVPPRAFHAYAVLSNHYHVVLFVDQPRVNHPQQQAKGLFPFVGNPRDEMAPGLAFKLTDYLELVDWRSYSSQRQAGNYRQPVPADTGTVK